MSLLVDLIFIGAAIIMLICAAFEFLSYREDQRGVPTGSFTMKLLRSILWGAIAFVLLCLVLYIMKQGV